MGIALLFIAIKGVSAVDMPDSLYGHTIEGTAAIFEATQSQMMDVNTITWHANSPAKSPATTGLATIQGISLVSRQTVLTSIDSEDERGPITQYEVQEGDVLSVIATDYGLHTQTLINANNLKNANALKPGLMLKIPAVDGILYVVKKGDNVSTIARKYKAESDQIISFNSPPMSGDLHAGQEILIPGGVLIPQSNNTTPSAKSQRFASLPKFDGMFVTPASFVITQSFHIRNGIDCANKKGTQIYASASGTVNLVQYSNKGYGNMLRITHSNEIETLYGHFSKIFVKTGDVVFQGQQIGEMGNTGYSTGPHLHFEVHNAYNILARYGFKSQVIAKQ